MCIHTYVCILCSLSYNIRTYMALNHDKVRMRSDSLSHQCMSCLDIIVCTVCKNKKRVWPHAEDRRAKLASGDQML